MNILNRILGYYNEYNSKKKEVLNGGQNLSTLIFKILRGRYPYLGDIRILNFGLDFQVLVKYKDDSDWGTYVFPTNDLDYEWEDYSEIVNFNNKLLKYQKWDKETYFNLCHEIINSYSYLNRFLYKYGYIYNVYSFIYRGDKYLTLCTNGNDYVTINCENHKIDKIQSYDDFKAEMLEDRKERIKNGLKSLKSTDYEE